VDIPHNTVIYFPLRLDPLRFYAGGHKRRSKLDFFLVILVYFMLA